jgi:outer membrane receptor protein involved in Fe transport
LACVAPAALSLLALQSGVARAADAPAASAPTAVTEVVVTAQKRQENAQNVGMSIQAASGEQLTKLGITDTSQLQKIVPGFLFTPTPFGTTVFTIRGVGFQDTSLASSPTVSVYVDESPLPYSALTNGALLDLQRVEVLKGPQGTLFGENATGGAINYIANKPTDSFQAGADLSFGRFDDTDLQAFVSGPVAPGLDMRLAVRTEQSGPWQKSYNTNQVNTIINGQGPDSKYLPQPPSTAGSKDFWDGRFSVLWTPNDNFKALVTLNGWRDRGETQMAQLFGLAPLSPATPLANSIQHFPLAPHNDQAASWNSCVNVSPFNPIANQAAGTTWSSPPSTGSVPESQGPGSVVQDGGQPTDCVGFKKNNTYYSGTLRMDYDLSGDLVLTSLTAYQKFNRTAPIDGSGMNIQDYQSYQRGKISSIYQELRLGGKFAGKGSWLVGANYEYDSTWDRFIETNAASTANPVAIPFAALCPVFGAAFGHTCSPAEAAEPAFLQLALGATQPQNTQKTTTYAAYANAEYPIRPDLTLQAGLRFTQENKSYAGCNVDGGDGTSALVGQALSNLLEVLNGSITPAAYLAGQGQGINSGPGGCGNAGPPPLYLTLPPGQLYTAKLDENNVSWRTGLNWQVTPTDLLYVNVSQGWKGGSFPTVPSANANQLQPVVQEGLLAYEGGFKTLLLNRTLQLNGAVFYYDYTNKQILGALVDPIFGALPALVNVPQSHVLGFELSAVWMPFNGMTITPAVSYQDTKIDSSSKDQCVQSTLTASGGGTCIPGHFYNFTAFGNYADLTGEHFPAVPEWQMSVDAEYDWKVSDQVTAFVGADVSYSSETHSFFLDRTPPASGAYNPLTVPGYALLDLRAGVSNGDWRFQLWGRNVTNTWYWTAADHVNDVLVRYTGMPVTYGLTLSYRYH